MGNLPTAEDVRSAALCLEGKAYKTPLLESLLLNATLMARKLESDSQSMVEQNQSMAVVENDYSSYSIPNVSLSQLSRKNCGWQTQPIPNSMIQIV